MGIVIKQVVLLLLIFPVFGIAQGSSVYDCNVRLIIRHPPCDSLRDLSRVNPKVNYRKMMKKDRKIINFLNYYRMATFSIEDLEYQINAINSYGKREYKSGDTTGKQLIMYERGLLKLFIEYEVNYGKITKRYYDLEINNPPGAGDSRPLDYHYKVFKLLKFCLEERFGCYDFGGTF